VADFLPEEKEPDGLLKAAEGDVEGVEVFGLAEEAVQADFQEVQFVQEGGGVGLVGMALLVGQLAAEMPGAEGHSIEEAAVDVRERGVVTDGTAPRLEARATIRFHHKRYSSGLAILMVPPRRDASAAKEAKKWCAVSLLQNSGQGG